MTHNIDRFKICKGVKNLKQTSYLQSLTLQAIALNISLILYFIGLTR
jgi:hypothetical protein